MNFVLMLVSVFTFVQYNCENLFDCKHDSLKNDIEFTPEGIRHWTTWKYWHKLDNVSRAITSCGVNGNDWCCPDMVALCEIENDSVAFDLTRRSPLRSLGYEYLITNSCDPRGIDVALLWRAGSFSLINHNSFSVKNQNGVFETRDVLYACGRILSDDTLHVFVVHAPSRLGNKKQRTYYRQAVFKKIAQVVDSINTVSKNPKIIIAGDFNDNPKSPALKPLYNVGLYNASANAKGQHGAKGSYKYKGKWENIDQVMISKALVDKIDACFINDAVFLLEDDETFGGVKPFRTSKPYSYQNGYSDHLPLVLRLVSP